MAPRRLQLDPHNRPGTWSPMESEWVTYLRLVDGRGLHGVEVPA